MINWIRENILKRNKRKWREWCARWADPLAGIVLVGKIQVCVFKLKGDLTIWTKDTGSKESLDSTLTHQSGASRSRPPRPDSKLSNGSADPSLVQIGGGRLSRSSSFSTLNSIGTSFERSVKSRTSLRDGSLTRIKNFFTKQKDWEWANRFFF